MESEVINYFGLSYTQTKILFAMEYQLVLADIQLEKKEDNRKEKLLWLNDWSGSIKVFLRNTMEGKSDSKLDVIFSDKLDMKVTLENLRKINSVNKLSLSLILLEATLFQAYYPLKHEALGPNNKIGKFIDGIKNTLANLKYSDEKIENELQTYATWMGFDSKCIKQFKDAYKKATNGIDGTTTKIITGIALGAVILAISAGFAAPAIGALFAAEGTVGIAATLSGLAALGGGAVAAGGFGVAGGIAVIVGGGALIGGGVGAGVGAGVISLMKTSSKFTLSQAAKLEVVTKEILLTSQKDIRIAQELIKNQRKVIAELEDQLSVMQRDSNTQKDEIENLKESIRYLKRAISRYDNYSKKVNFNEG